MYSVTVNYKDTSGSNGSLTFSNEKKCEKFLDFLVKSNRLKNKIFSRNKRGRRVEIFKSTEDQISLTVEIVNNVQTRRVSEKV
jgi:hypothetical protein